MNSYLNDNDKAGEVVRAACAMLDRSDVAAKWVRILDENMIDSVAQLRKVSDAQFNGMQFPVGLVINIRQLIAQPEGEEEGEKEAKDKSPDEGSCRAGAGTAAEATPPPEYEHVEEQYIPELIQLVKRLNENCLQPEVIAVHSEFNRTHAHHESLATVGLLGDTSAGKSDFIVHFGDLQHHGSKKPVVRDPNTHEFISTTQGMSVFKSRALFNKQVPMLHLLDFEGENGSIPKNLRESLHDWFFVNKTDDKVDEEQVKLMRREAVHRYLPSLAMLLSDVVILITRNTFVNSQTKDRVYELALNVLNDVDESARPVLLIVQNFCPIADMLTGQSSQDGHQDEDTEQFLQAHDPQRSLLQFFRDIRCYRLPDRRAFGVRPSTGQRVSGAEIYDLQLEYMRCFVAQHCSESLRRRQEQGFSIGGPLWFRLVEEINRRLVQGETVHMGRILSVLCTPPDAVVAQLAVIFHSLFPRDSLDQSRFRKARKFAGYALARFYAARIQQSGLSGSFSPSKWADPIQATASALWNELEKHAPCTARYQLSRSEKARSSSGLQCGRRQGSHSKHRTSDRVAARMERRVQLPGFWGWLGHRRTVYRWGQFVFEEWDGPFARSPDAESLESFRSFVFEQSKELINNNSNQDSAATKLASNLASAGFLVHEISVAPPPSESVACASCFYTPGGRFAWEISPESDSFKFVPVCPSCLPKVIEAGCKRL